MFSEQEWQALRKKQAENDAAWERWERRSARFVFTLLGLGIIAEAINFFIGG